ncbi:MAG: glycosyltransferase family 39 protein [Saprospiraceae bacterium]
MKFNSNSSSGISFRHEYLMTYRSHMLFIICFIGIAMVYLTHLGKVPVHFTSDECRRGLVAMEMNLSGDYVMPTLNGEPYLNKPPLYSWIISASYTLFGKYSAYALRFPVIVSILLHGLLIFFIVKRFCNVSVAALSALAYMTNGRTLMFDSMLGLLEHTLALLMYLGFMVIFIYGEKKKYLLLLTLSYFITALGFLIKGLPAVAHQGIALLVYFVFSGQTKRLFSPEHLTGILVFFLVLSAYYIPFIGYAHIDPENLFSTILHESSKRYYFQDVQNFFHIIVDYPVDFIYHFLPWTLFIILMLRKDFLAVAHENKFIWYNLLLFLANSPIYWLAALKNPHYLYFLLPLLFPFLFFIYFKSGPADVRVRILDGMLGLGIGIMIIASGYIPFIEKIAEVSGLWPKSIILSLAFTGLLLLFLYMRDMRLYVFVAAILFVRLAFNWFVIPSRVIDETKHTAIATEVYELVKDEPLFIMAEFPAGYYDGITYYLEKYRNSILRINREVDYNAYYLVDEVYLNKYPHHQYLQFPFMYADNNLRFDKEMFLVKFQVTDTH